MKVDLCSYQQTDIHCFQKRANHNKGNTKHGVSPCLKQLDSVTLTFDLCP